MFFSKAVAQQKDTTKLIRDPFAKEKLLYNTEQGSIFYSEEKSIGLIPSFGGFSNYVWGLGIGYGHFINGKGGGKNYGLSFAFDYHPQQKLYAPNLNLWIHKYAFFFGGNAGVKSIYYSQNSKSCFGIQPQIGIGYYKFFINYGYTFFTNDNFPELKHHAITISCYLTLFPARKKPNFIYYRME